MYSPSLTEFEALAANANLIPVVRRLLDAGISLQQIRTAVQHLRHDCLDLRTRSGGSSRDHRRECLVVKIPQTYPRADRLARPHHMRGIDAVADRTLSRVRRRRRWLRPWRRRGRDRAEASG